MNQSSQKQLFAIVFDCFNGTTCFAFSFLGNRARYEFIELDMLTGLDEQIELDTGLSKSIYQPASTNESTSGNRPRYVDTELESSRTVKQGLPLFRGDK